MVDQMRKLFIRLHSRHSIELLIKVAFTKAKAIKIKYILTNNINNINIITATRSVLNKPPLSTLSK